MIDLAFWMNVLGLALNGAGTLLLAYVVFSFEGLSKDAASDAVAKKNAPLLFIASSSVHAIKTADKSKWAMAFILFGVSLQIIALFFGRGQG
jgi:hypothetical protein